MALYSAVVLRHSEAEKTVRKIHGGLGTSLTRRGKDDSVLLAQFLRARSPACLSGIVVSSPRPQASETALILAKELELPLEIDPRLANINMGVFDGLTDEEARERDPEAMARLEAWRQGRLPVEEIRIPGSEALPDFLERVSEVLSEVQQRTEAAIFVGTRSIGIALINIMQGYNLGQGRRYERYRLDPGSVTILSRSSESETMRLDLVNVTSYLPDTREFVDD